MILRGKRNDSRIYEEKSIMGTYKYACPHERCTKLDEGIRKCNDCGKLIITDRGIDPKVEIDWEI